MDTNSEEICAYIAALSGAQKRGDCPLRGCRILQRAKTPGDTAPGTADGTEKVYCGISSMIYFCAKLETPWEDVHQSAFMEEMQSARTSAYIRKDFLLLWERQTVLQKIVSEAAALRHGDVRVGWANGFLPGRKDHQGYAWQLTELETDSLSVVLFTREEKPS